MLVTVGGNKIGTSTTGNRMFALGIMCGSSAARCEEILSVRLSVCLIVRFCYQNYCCN